MSDHNASAIEHASQFCVVEFLTGPGPVYLGLLIGMDKVVEKVEEIDFNFRPRDLKNDVAFLAPSTNFSMMPGPNS